MARTSSKDTKAKTSKSPAKKQPHRSRSRPRTETSSVVTDSSSRSGSPPMARRGSPSRRYENVPSTRRSRPRSRSPSRSPGRPPKNENAETTSGRRSLRNAPTEGQTDTGMALRPRRAAGTAQDQVSVPNGTHPTESGRRLRSSDLPRINDSIFQNISLTPSLNAAGAGPRVSTPLRSPRAGNGNVNVVMKSACHLKDSLIGFGNYVYWRLPNWKVMLAIFFSLMAIFLSVYVYVYHRQAVIDYGTITYYNLRKKLSKVN